MSDTPEADITSIDPSADDHPGWAMFQRKMRARQLTGNQLVFAWALFRERWDAKVGQMQAAATDWWCDQW